MGLREPNAEPENPLGGMGSQGGFAAAANERDSQPRPAIGWLLILGGLLSGLLAFGLGEPLYRIFRPELLPQDLMGTKIMVSSQDTQRAAATKNAAVAFGVLGLCLATSLGIVGGFARWPASSPARGGLSGAVLGSALGAGLPTGLLPFSIQAQIDYPEYDLIVALAVHALIWGLLGASAGLALAIGLGERRLIGSTSMSGLAGAVVGAITFELTGGTFFSLAETSRPISATWPTRLIARLLVTMGTATALALTLRQHETKRGENTAETPGDLLPAPSP
jgi:hypothetical protein